MSLRPLYPFDLDALRAADDTVYGRHADEPRPNPLFNEEGERRPLDADDPSQEALREEWMQAYAANGGAVEDTASSESVEEVVARCPYAEDDTAPPAPPPAPAEEVQPEPEPEPEVGVLEVSTRLLAICWDTDPEGFDSADPPLEGVIVEISGPGTADPVTSNADGIARFENLDIGNWSVQWRKDGYSIPARAPGTLTERVEANTTTAAEAVLQRDGLECQRKHAAPPSGSPSGVTLGPIFWSDEPWILVARDVLYVTLIAATVVGAIWAVAGAPPGQTFGAGGQTLTLVCFAMVGYLTNVIFGMPAGIPLIVAAFLMFLAALILSLFPSIGVFAEPDIWGLPISAGTWGGFAFGVLPGRRAIWSIEHLREPIISPAIVAAIITIAVFTMMALTTDPFSGNTFAEVMASIGVILLGIVCGTLAGLLGCAFVNEGRSLARELDAQTTGHDDYEDFLLPYAGERYCVQGHRGLVSHFLGQECSYDWSLPEGEPLLATKEGHIVAYIESHEFNVRKDKQYEEPNFIAIHHRDGTISKYLHLKKDGISAEIPRLADCVRTTMNEGAFDGGRMASNPLHVHEGQVIGQTGDVGISMFPHLHYYVQSAPGDRRPLVIKFRDADAARHEGRCWSMRKYRSSNRNRGAVQIPPPAAGGPA